MQDQTLSKNRDLWDKYRRGLALHRQRSAAAWRKRALQRATPPWVDQAELEEVQAEARRVSRATGVRHAVDHFWPLDGDFVSGLNVPANLRVIPAAENSSKGREWPKEHLEDYPGRRHERPGKVSNEDIEDLQRLEGYIQSCKADAMLLAIAEARHGQASPELVSWLFHIPSDVMASLMELPTDGRSGAPYWAYIDLDNHKSGGKQPETA